MPLNINTNLASLNAQRQLLGSTNELNTASERLSSGKRINSAADDAAGLVLSNRMTSQIRGLDQASRNAMDGISLLQVADGALDESSNILQRIRELSIQASNGIYSNVDRATIDAEVQQLVSELDRIAETTKFNGQNIFDGSLENVDLQVGAQSEETISFEVQEMSTSSLGLGSSSGDLIGSEINLSASGQLNLDLSNAAVEINDYSLKAVTGSDSIENLVDDINENVEGVSASLAVKLKADNEGDGVLQGGDTLTITAIDYDGGSTAFVIENTNTLEELVTAINSKVGSLITASLDDGKLALQSTKLATIKVTDTSDATGLGAGTIENTEIAEIVNGLTGSWLTQAEQLVSEKVPGILVAVMVALLGKAIWIGPLPTKLFTR